MDIPAIARICHEVNRALCRAFGDDSQVAWSDAPEWQQQSAIEGVQYALDNPNATPADQHQAWCEGKWRDGWVHGTVKDPVTKTHPCLVTYDQLPPEQRAKDYAFQAVVRSVPRDQE